MVELPAPGAVAAGAGRVSALRPPTPIPAPLAVSEPAERVEASTAPAPQPARAPVPRRRPRRAATRSTPPRRSATRPIAARDAAESERVTALNDRDDALSRRDAALRDVDRAVSEREEAEARARPPAARRSTASPHERDHAYAERNRMMQDTETVARERDQAAAERDAARAELSRVIPARDEALRERDAETSRADQAEAERDAALRERKTAIAQRDRARRERDRAMRAVGVEPPPGEPADLPLDPADSDGPDTEVATPPRRAAPAAGGVALPSRPLKRIGGASAGPAPEPKPLLTPVDSSRPRRLSRTPPRTVGRRPLGGAGHGDGAPARARGRRRARRRLHALRRRTRARHSLPAPGGREGGAARRAAAAPARRRPRAGARERRWSSSRWPPHRRPARRSRRPRAWSSPAGRSSRSPRTGGARRALLGGGVLVGGRVLIRSPDDPPPPGDADLLDLVLARGGGGFGSGSHPTTRMCLELLLDLAPGGGAVDLGCGLGTLAIAAARLGWAPVAGVDRMAEAVDVARGNGARNGVDVAWAVADLEAEPVALAPLVLVNAPPPVQARVAGAAAAGPGRVDVVIASGMLLPELRAALPAYAEAGLRPVRALEDDGWAAARLERTDA